jgi:hypothetical protein
MKELAKNALKIHNAIFSDQRSKTLVSTTGGGICFFSPWIKGTSKRSEIRGQARK